MLTHLDPGFADDPHAVWDRLRAEDPVTFVPEIDAWVITGHPEARAALRDPALSPSPRFWAHHEEPAPGQEPTPRDRFLSNGLFYVGPQDHVRLRRLLSAAFTPKGVEAQRSMTTELVEDLLGSHGPGDEIDLFADVYRQIPPRVIASMVGFDGADADAFVEIARTLVLVIDPTPSAEVQQRIDHAVLELAGMVTEASDHRRRHPGDDLLSRLLAVEAGDGGGAAGEDAAGAGQRLSEEERVALVAGLVIAGSGTTAQFIGHTTAALLDRPELLTAVADPGARDGLIEEALRWTTMGFGAPRFVVTDTEIDGHHLAAGSMLFVGYAAANHDPRVFDDPHHFDVDRDASDHVAFSVGTHFCLGAALARLESEVVLGHVLDRFGSTMRWSAPPRFSSSFLFRDVESLPLVL